MNNKILNIFVSDIKLLEYKANETMLFLLFKIHFSFSVNYLDRAKNLKSSLYCLFCYEFKNIVEY